MFQELVIAACLMLVLEGMLPFLAPTQWRRVMMNLLSMQDRQIRTMGLVSMLAGVILLYMLN